MLCNLIAFNVDHSLKALFQQGITILLLDGFGVMSAGAGWIILEKMSWRFKKFRERLFSLRR